jgi:SAM-dependent methyltransferase
MKVAIIDKDPNGYVSFFRSHGVFGYMARDAGVELITGIPWGWSKLIQADVAVFIRPHSDDDLKLYSIAKEVGIPLVTDFDDNFVDIPPWLGQQTGLQALNSQESRQKLSSFLLHATKRMFSTQALAKAMCPKGCHSSVIPNAWNDRIFKFSRLPRLRKRISWRGGGGHEQDLEMFLPAMRNVSLRHHPQWMFFGTPHWRINELRGSSVYHIKWESDLFGYLTAFLQSQPWVHIVPLVPCPFNECKSSNSWVEATAAGALVVAPDYEEFRKPGVFNYSTGSNAVADFEAKLEQALGISDAEAQSRLEMSRDYINENLTVAKVNAVRLRLLNLSSMHASVTKWVSGLLSDGRVPMLNRSVLEIGSLNVNGSVRSLFSASSRYCGVDLRPGDGVDRVMNAHSLEFAAGEFDVVISTETLEHDSHFWLSVGEMGRVLSPGGFLIITARGNGFPEHAFPDDFYRFMPSSFRVIFNMAGCDAVEIMPDPECPGLFGLGIKTGFCGFSSKRGSAYG